MPACLCVPVPAADKASLSGDSPHTIVRAATPRLTLEIKFAVSPLYSAMTPGQPVPALTVDTTQDSHLSTYLYFIDMTGESGGREGGGAIEDEVCLWSLGGLLVLFVGSGKGIRVLFLHQKVTLCVFVQMCARACVFA